MGTKGEKPLAVTKIICKESNESKDKAMNLRIESFVNYHQCFDSPLTGFAAREVLESDVGLLHLKEVELDEEEPRYEIFGKGKNLKLATSITDPDGDHKVNCDCNDCTEQDECDKFVYGPYCVAAIKRHFEENKYNSSLRCAYQVYVTHYKRVLDFHSYNTNNNRKGMRQTEFTKPTYCMKEGSLKYALFWLQWQIENGPEKG